ncbi:hypothetical protein [Geomicrobium sediminis]|uniref:Membrane protein YkvI n=1 Tax=Geomicrobium sediminis TaxID=1347788 RepID=A0ABS2PAU0_9BACL|nr:hypothetical protein [Geomicrobium sediminis]MBM7632251.1 putative membrane protein YkvI [Geomicrobium sediminis]
MKTTLRVAGVYVGAVVGAGYASGQEMLQFFVSHGVWGIVGTAVTMILLPLLGYHLVRLGDQLNVKNHKKVLYHLCGKYLGPVIDLVLTFFLFGLGAIMIAGSGSLFEQSFGLAPIWGYLFMSLVLILTLVLDTNKIITIISSLSPYILVLLFIIVIYSIFASQANFTTLESLASQQLTVSPHWTLSTLISVSFNFMVGFAIMVVVGSVEKDKQGVRNGAILGGVALGVIAIIVALGVYLNLDRVHQAEMPILLLANEFNPVVGFFMALGLLMMIYSTAATSFYTFLVRFFEPKTNGYRGAVVVTCILGLSFGFIGFVDLVNTVYPLLGYIGFIVIVSLIINIVRRNGRVKREVSHD